MKGLLEFLALIALFTLAMYGMKELLDVAIDMADKITIK